MDYRACLKWLGLPIALAFSVHAWLGCSQSDLSGYHRVDHSAAKTNSESSSSPNLTTQPLEMAATPSDFDLKAADNVVPASVVDASVSALTPVNKFNSDDVRAVVSLPSVNPRPADGPANAEPEATKEPTELRKIELLVKEKTFRSEPKTGALRVSFDDLDLLKILNMEPVVANAEELMPDWLLGLNGKSIRIRGYMFPTYDTEGIERFVLARDNQICCFGRDPKIYDLIQVDMKTGKTTNYIPATRAFDVVGTFRIHMQSEDGKLFGLYLIEQAEVIDR